MKKKTLLMSVSAIALLCSVASCGHEHEFGSSWSKDSTHHWHAATCEHSDLTLEYEEHTLVDGYCQKCNYYEIVVIYNEDYGDEYYPIFKDEEDCKLYLVNKTKKLTICAMNNIQRRMAELKYKLKKLEEK